MGKEEMAKTLEKVIHILRSEVRPENEYDVMATVANTLAIVASRIEDELGMNEE